MINFNNSIFEKLEKIENKLDILCSIVSDIKQNYQQTKKIERSKTKLENNPKLLKEKENAKTIYAFYKITINNKARFIPKAEQKIISRLKEYNIEELKKAIENFSQDTWWMKNNSHRGISWFFHSEDRIEQFLNLTPKKDFSKLELTHNEQSCKIVNRNLKIYAPWSGQWLDWNRNHPQYEKFVLKDSGKIIHQGIEAYKNFMKLNEINF